MSKGAIDGFTALDAKISVYYPEKAALTGKQSQDPGLIVVCSWMDAAPKHIAKYTIGYQQLYPQSNILLVQSTFTGTFFGAQVTSALDVVGGHVEEQSSLASTDGRSRVLLHALSNGGAINAVRLVSQLKERGYPTPFDRIILDCCPGTPHMDTGTKAVTYSLPDNYWIRLIGSYLVYITLFAYMVTCRALGVGDQVSKVRHDLNDVKLLDPSIPRLYMYSEADKLVDANDVHVNAEEARKSGFVSVREERFLTAPHCILLREDADRYWKAVREHVSQQRDLPN